jgi:hypothetical protein
MLEDPTMKTTEESPGGIDQIIEKVKACGSNPEMLQEVVSDLEDLKIYLEGGEEEVQAPQEPQGKMSSMIGQIANKGEM